MSTNELISIEVCPKPTTCQISIYIGYIKIEIHIVFDRKVSQLSVSRVAVYKEMNSFVGGLTVCFVLCRKQCLRESGVNIRVRA